jgi:hypothetical protein
MNTKLNKIFKSFEEVNLKSQDVNLGLLQDAEKLVTASEKSWLGANQKVNIINQKAKEAVESLINANNENAKALNLVKILMKNTKDLGLPISPQTQKMFDKLTTREKSLVAGIAKIKGVNVEQIKG